jgi:BMFP domain-containing protein YqiC
MNTPAIRVIGPSGSGRSSIAAALHKLLKSNGVSSELINCAVDETTWRTELRPLMSGKLLPIIVSPVREGDGIPPVMGLMQELAVARQSAQDMHEKCQALEAKLAATQQRLDSVSKGASGFNDGMRYAQRVAAEHQRNVREEVEKRFDRMLAAYKDATRSDLRSLRQGSCPNIFMVSHAAPDGTSTPHVVMSFHKPSIEEVREVCGYPEQGEISIGPILAPMIPPRARK